MRPTYCAALAVTALAVSLTLGQSASAQTTTPTTSTTTTTSTAEPAATQDAGPATSPEGDTTGSGAAATSEPSAATTSTATEAAGTATSAAGTTGDPAISGATETAPAEPALAEPAAAAAPATAEAATTEPAAPEPTQKKVKAGEESTKAASAGVAKGGPLPKSGCRTRGFLVNDFGKEGPSRDAQDLLDKDIAAWTAANGIAKYKTGPKKVDCKLFLNFGFFDEWTCTAKARVCW